jgi:hypothetical protein
LADIPVGLKPALKNNKNAAAAVLLPAKAGSPSATNFSWWYTTLNQPHEPASAGLLGQLKPLQNLAKPG